MDKAKEQNMINMEQRNKNQRKKGNFNNNNNGNYRRRGNDRSDRGNRRTQG